MSAPTPLAPVPPLPLEDAERAMFAALVAFTAHRTGPVGPAAEQIVELVDDEDLVVTAIRAPKPEVAVAVMAAARTAGWTTRTGGGS